MTPAQSRKALVGYIRYLANELGLRDWTFELEYHQLPPIEDASASIDCIFGRKYAVIRFADTFFQADRSDQRNTMVHELIHCHLDGMDAVIRDMGVQMGSFVHSVFQDNHHRELELATDGLATAISKKYLLPPKGLVRP